MSNDRIAPNIKDNSPDRELIKVIKDQLNKAKDAKFAIGYFFLSGFSLVKDDFPDPAEAQELAALEKDNMRTVMEVYDVLRGDGEVQEWIERIRGHEWVKVVEE